MDAEAVGEIFRDLGPIRIRRMFGGKGIYHDDVMFALETEGELYLKTDALTADAFRAAGSRPFAFKGRKGRKVTTSYWLMPESALDDPEEAAQLARAALGAAARARSRA